MAAVDTHTSQFLQEELQRTRAGEETRGEVVGVEGEATDEEVNPEGAA